MAERRGGKPADKGAHVETAPIRWDRVDSIARRKRRWVLAGVGLVLLLVIAFGVLFAFAGKSAIDPSFRPPILSNASADLDLTRPTMEWASADAAGVEGYFVSADLDAEGLKGNDLLPVWTVRPLEHAGGGLRDGYRLSRGRVVVPDSNVDHEVIREWIPLPAETGRYVFEVRLRTVGGRVMASDREVFSVVGSNCCRRYETPTYVAPLPKGWYLEENYEANPVDRYVTVAIGPHENSIVIDTSTIDPENAGKTAIPFQEKQEQGFSERDDYRRLAKRVYRAPDGEPIVEWSYELEGDVFTNTLFFRGPSGFAVMGRSDRDRFGEMRELSRLVAHSLVAKSVVRAGRR